MNFKSQQYLGKALVISDLLKEISLGAVFILLIAVIITL